MITQSERQNAIERQIRRIHKRIEKLDRQSNRYGWLRVGLFFTSLLIGLCIGILLAWWAGIVCFLLLMSIFGLVAYHQRRIDHSLTRHKLWLHLKATEIARIQRDWSGIPDAYTPEQRSNHPFEIDLDITGKHSIHRLLNTAISAEGTQRLHEWLLTTRPEQETILARQMLMQELAPMSAFRTRLTMKATLTARSGASQFEDKQLLSWLQETQKITALVPLIILSHVLTISLLTLLVLNLLGLLPAFWLIVLIAEIILLAQTKEKRGNLFEHAYYLRDAFAQFHSIFGYLETYHYGNKPRLRQHCQPYIDDPVSGPSALLKRVQRIANGATLEKNGLVWLLVNLLFPWDFYLAQRFQRYKDVLAERLPVWLETWFELETLSSLATFAYLNPAYTLPEIHTGTDQQQPFCARGLGHPLLAEAAAVVNDFSMPQVGEIFILTGSNMAGKSTFLRSMGANLCLAYAGAPVHAGALATQLFRLFTCIKISDSVTEGYSYFYAEVRRLRMLLDELDNDDEQRPLFFLIDEIFRGTNNRERRIGSEAYIQVLTEKHCLGLLSTHDLELVNLAERLPQIKNYHFRESVVDGQMIFDYILRPGPCSTTNALKIMAMEGLPVDLTH